MPPAFVLSQDQTLKFIPGPPSRRAAASGAAPTRPAPRQGPPNVRNYKCANRQRPHGRRPRIPSHLHNLNQQIPAHPDRAAPTTGAGLSGRRSRASAQNPTPSKGPRLYRPALSQVNPRFHGQQTWNVGARVSAEAKIGTATPVVQRNPRQELHRRQISPSARSSASMCSGAGSSPPALRSGGATACGR